MQQLWFWIRYGSFSGALFISSYALAQNNPKGLLPHKGKLAKKLRSGNIETSDVPLFMLHMVEYLLMIAGGIAVVFIMVGGVQFIIGGLTENKDQGKSTIKYAIIGLVVAFLSWFIVEQVQYYLTSAEV